MRHTRALIGFGRGAGGWRKAVLVLSLLALFSLVSSFFLGEMGFIRYRKLVRQKQELSIEIASLKASRDALSSRVVSLGTDKEYIEQLAREQGLVKDGETVYQYEDGR